MMKLNALVYGLSVGTILINLIIERTPAFFNLTRGAFIEYDLNTPEGEESVYSSTKFSSIFIY